MRYLNFFSFLMLIHEQKNKNCLFPSAVKDLKFISFGSRITLEWVGGYSFKVQFLALEIRHPKSKVVFQPWFFNCDLLTFGG